MTQTDRDRQTSHDIELQARIEVRKKSRDYWGRAQFATLLTLIWQMRLFSSILHSCVTVSDEESVVLLPSLTFLSNKAILSEEHRDLRQIFQGSNSFWGDARSLR